MMSGEVESIGRVRDGKDRWREEVRGKKGWTKGKEGRIDRKSGRGRRELVTERARERDISQEEEEGGDWEAERNKRRTKEEDEASHDGMIRLSHRSFLDAQLPSGPGPPPAPSPNCSLLHNLLLSRSHSLILSLSRPLLHCSRR